MEVSKINSHRDIIMVIDDELPLEELLERILVEAGFDVIKAHDGITALTLLEEVEPALILLDVMMPSLDGFQVISEVRKKHDTPIIMLTARISDEDVSKALTYGADDFIRKPFSAKELVARVQTMLRRTSTNTIKN